MTIAFRRKFSHLAAVLLVVTISGFGVAALTSVTETAGAASETVLKHGSQLYTQNCASCHGLSLEGTSDGPTLIGIGSAAIDFQIATGRMPLSEPSAQSIIKKNIFSEQEINAIAEYVSTFGTGPAIPAESLYSDWENAELALGGELYRTNCAQCHNFAGSGGALTQGKFAPNLLGSSPKIIWEAMITGPQSMPIFTDSILNSEEKLAIIRHIEELKKADNPGGIPLGRFGPFTEGLVIFVVGLGSLIAVSIWIGAKVR